MRNTINFLGVQTGRRIAIANQLRGVIKALIWIVGIELFASLIFIGWQLGIKNQTGKLERQNQQAEAQVDQYRDLESMIYTVGTRAKLIKPLLKPDNKKISSLIELTNILSNQGILPKNGFKIGKDSSLQLEGVVESVYDLDKIKTIMDEIKNQGYFNSYKVDGFNRIQSGQYRLSIVVYMEEVTQ